MVLYFLHRRHVQKLRREDANDQDKALDFGMDEVAPLSKKKKRGTQKGQPEMTVAEVHKEIRRDRGMSLDLDAGNPYLLPPGLQTSRESIHSLSRSAHSNHDPYRPATTYFSNDRYPSPRRGPDDSSSYTASSHRMYHDNESSQNLLRNAQRMSRSLPPTQRNSLVSGSSTPISPELPNAQMPRRPPPVPRLDSPPSHPPSKEDVPASANTERSTPATSDSSRLNRINGGTSPLIDSQSPPPLDQMPTLPSLDNSSPNAEKPTRKPVGLPSNPRAKKAESLGEGNVPSSDFLAQPLPQLSVQALDGEFGLDRYQPSPPREVKDQDLSLPKTQSDQGIKYEQDFSYDPRRLTMGIRPLPPEDPSENPEERANRIRSFYKEYFDESRPGPVYTQEDYYDGYDYDYGNDGAFYDPATGEYYTTQVPFAEPMGRRAMTPPPQGPPRFHGMAPSISGNFAAGPRAYSSASGRFGPMRRPPPKKAAPPPKPLNILPTPHMLKDDTFLPIDFAPPTPLRDRVAGRVPDSPKGGMKPFTAQMRPVQSLASSFDDLAVMPSP